MKKIIYIVVIFLLGIFVAYLSYNSNKYQHIYDTVSSAIKAEKYEEVAKTFGGCCDTNPIAKVNNEKVDVAVFNGTSISDLTYGEERSYSYEPTYYIYMFNVDYGYVQQIGEPKEIYDNPANAFVAGFIGTPPMNFIQGKIDENGVFTAKDRDADLKVPAYQFKKAEEAGLIGKNIMLGIRPEHITDDEELFEKYGSVLELKIDVAELLGASTNIYTQVSGYNVCAVVKPRNDLRMGQSIKLAFDMDKCHLFDVETEKCLTSKL